jgi:hypothetical protein
VIVTGLGRGDGESAEYLGDMRAEVVAAEEVLEAERLALEEGM